MRLVFMGSGGFALPSLRTLLASRYETLALITQPDKPAGRGHTLRMPETKQVALERGIPVHQPPRVRADVSVALLRELAPDVIVVVAYGQIIPPSILAIPPLGIINVHGSLLPRYRGAAPIQWSIARGEVETGVTTMRMDEGLDTGPILLQKSFPITAEDTGGSLEAKLASLGASLLLETLERWEAKELTPKPQDDSLATLAPRIKKSDAVIDWNLSAREIHDRARAFDPWPVAHVLFADTPLRIWKTRVASESREIISAGQILAYEGDRVLVACGGRSRLLIEEVQLAGKARMSAAAFARGQRLSVSDRFGPA